MSIGVRICFLQGGYASELVIPTLGSLLSVAAGIQGSRKGMWTSIAVYRGGKPFVYGSQSKDERIVLNTKLDGSTSCADVLDLIRKLGDPANLSVSITGPYGLGHEGWLEVQFYGPNFERGWYFAAEGPFALHFSDVRTATQSDTAPHEHHLSPEHEAGPLLTDAFQRIISLLHPEHAVVVLEGDYLYPLNFLGVYHSSYNGYLHDMHMIVDLYNKGGSYFPDDSLVSTLPPFRGWKERGTPGDFGFLRREPEVTELSRRIDSLLLTLPTLGSAGYRIRSSEIQHVALQTCPDFVVFSDDSLALLGEAYLHDFYLGLFDKALIRVPNAN